MGLTAEMSTYNVYKGLINRRIASQPGSYQTSNVTTVVLMFTIAAVDDGRRPVMIMWTVSAGR